MLTSHSGVAAQTPPPKNDMAAIASIERTTRAASMKAPPLTAAEAEVSNRRRRQQPSDRLAQLADSLAVAPHDDARAGRLHAVVRPDAEQDEGTERTLKGLHALPRRLARGASLVFECRRIAVAHVERHPGAPSRRLAF